MRATDDRAGNHARRHVANVADMALLAKSLK
jgi:hypothetical protein